MKPSTISQLFGQSPFPLLKEHMEKVKLCLDEVRPMMEAVAEGKGAENEAARRIMRIEHEVDLIKVNLRDNLSKSIFLPVDRSDLLAVLSAQDGIADMCEDLAVLVTVRTTRIPDAFRDGLFEYLDKCLEAAYLCVDITREFDRMIESSFGGHEAEKILGMIDAVSALEWEADKKQYRLAQHLFQLEDRLSPVDVMLWFEIFKVIGNIANSAEKMTKRLRTFFKA
ncbi:MAG: TIGR00153 family protein [Acidobacteria bacterium]|jgi:predicted phosphate transport protein (TIGR00153 family)|nr:TIGR00153 family protein [Acidobacteriota bacterium]